MTSARRKWEESAEGCRAREQADRIRAAEVMNSQVRGALERSADAWKVRAALLDRLEARFLSRGVLSE